MGISEDLRIAAKQKLIQVFTYLQALHQLKQPIIKHISGQLWSQSLADLPVHSNVTCDFTEGISPSERIDEEMPEVLLRVKRPDRTACPKPPELLQRWLKPDWEKIHTRPERLESMDSYREAADSGEYEAYVERFDQDEERVRLWENWTQEREAWQEREWPVRRTIKLFEDLYMLYSWIERERDAVELMIGDGILHWELTPETIHHPVLLQRIELVFDPEGPEFTVIASEAAPEFHGSLFRDVPEVSPGSIKKCTADLLEAACSPWISRIRMNICAKYPDTCLPRLRLFLIIEHLHNRLRTRQQCISGENRLFSCASGRPVSIMPSKRSYRIYKIERNSRRRLPELPALIRGGFGRNAGFFVFEFECEW